MDNDNSIISVDNVTVDPFFHLVFVNHTALNLTHKEYRTLEFLMRQKGLVVSRDTLIEHLYGGASEHDSNVIDIFVRRLRKKLAIAGASPLIDSSWGKGFKIAG